MFTAQNINQDRYTIYSVPLSHLTEIDVEFNDELFAKIANNVPQACLNHPKYYLLNTNLTINSYQLQPIIQKLSVFLQYASRKAQYIQLTKN